MVRTASRHNTQATARLAPIPAHDGESRTHPRRQESTAPAILIVERDQLLRWALYETLLDAGYRVLPVRDEAQAKELLDHMPEPFAAAVVDEDAWPMTGSGEAWLRARWRGLPLLVLADAPTPSLTRHLRKMGVADLLVKPFEIDDLHARVARLVRLGRRAARHRARTSARAAA